MGCGRLKNHLDNLLEALFSGRVVFPFLLLLIVLFIDRLFLGSVFSEVDILEHFLFGFIISEFAGRVATSEGVGKLLIKSMSKENVGQQDLFIRLLAFLSIGGLLWESLERFLFPAFGAPCNPFFAFPITLRNIDGTIDVTVGILGCILAWYTAKRNGAHSQFS